MHGTRIGQWWESVAIELDWWKLKIWKISSCLSSSCQARWWIQRIK